jgi:hypothetical protein
MVELVLNQFTAAAPRRFSVAAVRGRGERLFR